MINLIIVGTNFYKSYKRLSIKIETLLLEEILI